ncbi:MAG: molecular chaperone HtpG [Lachnospirales bacterium]
MTTTTSNLSKGTLSIENKNVFSILKKWLYTENDIVFRELISNAKDAIEKRVSLVNEDLEGKINVLLNKEEGTITISDNGIGMTYEEVSIYINQIAFSGATDFIKATQSGENTIIGHFGVGFYSSFMLCDNVGIVTKSYKDDLAVKWDCTSDMDFTMEYCEKDNVGTDVILYLKESNPYVQKPELIYNAVKKYFEFASVKINYNAEGYDNVQVNEPLPIWKKIGDTSESHKDALNTFYKEYFNDVSDPIFTVNIASLDIGVSGILFFRETRGDTHELDGTIKIYCRGVYIGENIPELIPSFVNLQSGIIECDNLPLVVSRNDIRSEGQKDGQMELISECLAQEVTIALHDIFENKRSEYEKNWDNLNAFIKYSVLKDKTFGSVMTRKVIFRDLYGNLMTIDEYTQNAKESSDAETIYYTSDEVEQAHYIEIFKKCGMNALHFDHVIDQPYMQRYEVVKPNLKFVRIDSNIESIYEGTVSDSDKETIEKITSIFSASVGKRLEKFKIKVTNLNQVNISTVIINDEKSRRMADMLEIYGYINKQDVNAQSLQSNSTFIINLQNKIVQRILNTVDESLQRDMCNQLFDLSLLSGQKLEAEDVLSFILRSERLLLDI